MGFFIRQFADRTREQYKQEELEQMEPWKRDVLRLHEQAGFIFYFEEADQDETSLVRFVVKGEAAKGRAKPGTGLFLLDGQGRLLGRALSLSDTEEKEEKRIGLAKEKRNCFRIKITELYGEPVSSMEINAYRRQLASLWASLSIFSDARIRDDHQIEGEKRVYEAVPAGETGSEAKENTWAAQEIQKDLFKENSKSQKLFLKFLNQRKKMKK